jgi:hypothetical protein
MFGFQKEPGRATVQRRARAGHCDEPMGAHPVRRGGSLAAYRVRPALLLLLLLPGETHSTFNGSARLRTWNVWGNFLPWANLFLWRNVIIKYIENITHSVFLFWQFVLLCLGGNVWGNFLPCMTVRLVLRVFLAHYFYLRAHAAYCRHSASAVTLNSQEKVGCSMSVVVIGGCNVTEG